MSRLRNGLFTLQVSSEEQLRVLDPSQWPHCKYAIWQLEAAPTTGQLHLQGYAEFDSPVSLSTLRNLDGVENAHWEARRGSADQAREYCSKQETRVDGPWTFGLPSEQGKRSDLLRVATRIRQGEKLERIAEDEPATVIRYQRGLSWFASFHAPQRVWAMELVVVVGPSGVGKSRYAMESYPEAYWKPPGAWWPGYTGQETVVLDEFYGSSMAFSELLRLCDRYPMTVETKGGHVAFTSKRLVFTSNQHPCNWYSAEKTHQGPWETNPLNRRLQEFGKVIEMGFVPKDPPHYGAPQNDNPFEINEIDLNPPNDILDLEGLFSE